MSQCVRVPFTAQGGVRARVERRCLAVLLVRETVATHRRCAREPDHLQDFIARTMPFYGWITKDGEFKEPWTFTFVRIREHVTDIESINQRLTDMAREHITTLEKRGHTARNPVAFKCWTPRDGSAPLNSLKPHV